MRRVTALLLTGLCGVLFALWARELVALISGRATFGGGGLPVEYLSFAIIGIFCAFGLYAGVGALPRRPESTGSHRPMRIAGWILAGFGGVGACTLVMTAEMTISSAG
jgi:hypothetical protein